MNSELEGETRGAGLVQESNSVARAPLSANALTVDSDAGVQSADVIADADDAGEASSPMGEGASDQVDEPVAPVVLIRLQKVLAAAGVGSRRACEELIASGRVRVGTEIVDQLGARVDPDSAVVFVDGRRISVRPGVVHLALNKPQGVLSAMSDDRGRPTVGDMVRDRPERLFHVGRLDADTEGLLILTNDGQLAHQLMHPSNEVPKTYLAEVEGTVTRDTTRLLLRGVQLTDGPAVADGVRIVQSAGGLTLIEIVLHEGRNRIVRRIFDEVGHPVRRLVRTAIGPLLLGSQRSGSLRELSNEEVSSLYALSN
jgi:23S rRNA pseudouridine2605 synthase